MNNLDFAEVIRDSERDPQVRQGKEMSTRAAMEIGTNVVSTDVGVYLELRPFGKKIPNLEAYSPAN